MHVKRDPHVSKLAPTFILHQIVTEKCIDRKSFLFLDGRPENKTLVCMLPALPSVSSSGSSPALRQLLLRLDQADENYIADAETSPRHPMRDSERPVHATKRK